MDKWNAKKSGQLGMSNGKANNILKKSIMFMLVQVAGLDVCFRCGKRIETVNEFSIDHKTNWLDSEDPIALFFSLDNISFSHYSCNIKSKRMVPRKPVYTKDELRERNKERMRKYRSTDEYRNNHKLYMRERYINPDLWELHKKDSRNSYLKKHPGANIKKENHVELCCPECGKIFDRMLSKTHLGKRKGLFSACSRRCSGILKKKIQNGEEVDFSKNVIRIYRN